MGGKGCCGSLSLDCTLQRDIRGIRGHRSRLPPIIGTQTLVSNAMPVVITPQATCFVASRCPRRCQLFGLFRSWECPPPPGITDPGEGTKTGCQPHLQKPIRVDMSHASCTQNLRSTSPSDLVCHHVRAHSPQSGVSSDRRRCPERCSLRALRRMSHRLAHGKLKGSRALCCL